MASSISPSEEGAFTDKRKVGKPTEKREGTKGSVKPFRPYDCLAVIDPRNRSAEVVPVIIFEKCFSRFPELECSLSAHRLKNSPEAKTQP